MSPEEVEALRAELQVSTAKLEGVAVEIAKSEAFKQHVAMAAETAFIILGPMMNAAAAAGGPAASLLANMAGRLITTKLQALATKKEV